MTSPPSDASEAPTEWIAVQDGADLVRPYVHQAIAEPTADPDGPDGPEPVHGAVPVHGSGSAAGYGTAVHGSTVHGPRALGPYPAVGALRPGARPSAAAPARIRPTGRRTAGPRRRNRTALIVGAGTLALAAVAGAVAGASHLLSAGPGDAAGPAQPMVTAPLAAGAPGTSAGPSGSESASTGPGHGRAAAAAPTGAPSSPTGSVPPSASASGSGPAAVTTAPHRNGPGGGSATPAAGPDEALHALAVDSGHTQAYTAANAVDGLPDSYWESTDNAFPQSLTVDLGAVRTVGRLVLRLPPLPAWNTRTETFAVLASTSGAAFSTVVGQAGYTFDPGSGNTVTVTLPARPSVRYLRLTFTGNTGWPAGQLSELQAYAS